MGVTSLVQCQPALCRLRPRVPARPCLFTQASWYPRHLGQHHQFLVLYETPDLNTPGTHGWLRVPQTSPQMLFLGMTGLAFSYLETLVLGSLTTEGRIKSNINPVRSRKVCPWESPLQRFSMVDGWPPNARVMSEPPEGAGHLLVQVRVREP